MPKNTLAACRQYIAMHNTAKHLAERAPTAYDFTAVGSYDYVDYDPGMEPYNR